MGIHNDVVLVYGIEFSFDQVKHITDLKEVVEESESDNVLDIWSEFDLEYACARLRLNVPATFCLLYFCTQQCMHACIYASMYMCACM